jgi:DNA-binding transcriptional regulator YiaG
MASEIQQSAETVYRFRVRLKLTQENLAHELGVTVSTINRWERGWCYPSRIARVLLRQKGCDLPDPHAEPDAFASMRA